MANAKFKAGDKVMVINDTGTKTGPYLPKNSIVTVNKVTKSGSMDIFYAEEWLTQGFFYCNDFKLAIFTKESLEKELANVIEQANLIKSRLRFLEENGLNKYDTTQYKVYETLQILKTKKKDIDKAKIIAELINK